jgi:hypothetical protein
MFIPDPTFFHPGSRIRTVSIPDPGSASKYFNLTPKKTKKWFLSSRKYDPGCSSRIRMLTFSPSRIPDPGVKKAPDPGSRIRIRNTVCLERYVLYQEEGGAVPGQPVRDDGGECVLPGLPAGLPTRGQEGEAAYASVHQVFFWYIFLATLHQVLPNIFAF